MDRSIFWLFLRRFLFVLIAVLVMVVQTLPLQETTPYFVPPDIIMAFCFAWCLRRPDVMSPILIGGTFLLTDFILSRPPGLWALIILFASLYLTQRQRDLNQAVFLIEWGYVTATMLTCFLTYFVLLKILFLPAQDALLTGLQALITILVYPLVTLVSVQVFGISKERRIEDV